MGFLSWEIQVVFPRECNSQATQPTVHARCLSVFIIRRALTWTTGSLTCAQILMHAIADGGCSDTVSECAVKKLILGEKSFAAPEIRTYVSGVPIRRFTN